MYQYISLLTERYPVLKACQDSIEDACRILEDSYRNGGKLLVGGNGGSCADSEHIVGELMKSFVKKRPLPAALQDALRETDPGLGAKLAEGLQGALPAIALTGHPGLSTAFANDADPEMVFAQQVNGYGTENDVLLAISTSGNSGNLLLAAVTAKAKGMRVITLTGRDGGRLARLSDCVIIVPLQETYQIQELHLPVYHALCLQLEEDLF